MDKSANSERTEPGGSSALVDSAAGTSAIQQPFCGQDLCACDGVKYNRYQEVALHALVSVNDTRRLAEFVKSLSDILASSS